MRKEGEGKATALRCRELCLLLTLGLLLRSSVLPGWWGWQEESQTKNKLISDQRGQGGGVHLLRMEGKLEAGRNLQASLSHIFAFSKVQCSGKNPHFSEQPDFN